MRSEKGGNASEGGSGKLGKRNKTQETRLKKQDSRNKIQETRFKKQDSRNKKQDSRNKVIMIYVLYDANVMNKRWEYVNLKVRQKSMDLIDEIYLLTKKFPKDEMFGLTSQIRRAASSIALNIWEGNWRSSDKEFKRFLDIANGSCVEVEIAIRISARQSYIEESQKDHILQLLYEVRRMMSGLSWSL